MNIISNKCLQYFIRLKYLLPTMHEEEQEP